MALSVNLMPFQRVKEYADAGVNQFFLAFQDPFDFKALELFKKSVNEGGGGGKWDGGY